MRPALPCGPPTCPLSCSVPLSLAALLLGTPLLFAACTSPDAPAADPATVSPTTDASGDVGGPGACNLDVLSFEAAAGDDAAGNRSVNVTARNLGAGTCLLRGFPTIALLGADGDPLSLETEPSTGTYFLPEQAVQPVLVPPSATAFFQIAYRSAATSGETLPDRHAPRRRHRDHQSRPERHAGEHRRSDGAVRRGRARERVPRGHVHAHADRGGHAGAGIVDGRT